VSGRRIGQTGGNEQDGFNRTNLPAKVVERHDGSGDVERRVEGICDEVF
jgi:hypothetical protein